MNNYQYITASLPDFIRDFEPQSFDYDGTVAFIRANCSPSDCRLLDWLEFGLDGNNLSPRFYRAVSKSSSRFLKEYFSFDRKVREAKMKYLKMEGDIDPELLHIFRTPNLLEREKMLDALMWDKAEELVLFDIFNMDIILSFIVKARTVRRWNNLDQKEGARLFALLVKEVRGTYGGVEFDPLQ